MLGTLGFAIFFTAGGALLVLLVWFQVELKRLQRDIHKLSTLETNE